MRTTDGKNDYGRLRRSRSANEKTAMRGLTGLLSASFALTLAGCQTSALDGAGYRKIVLAPATAPWLVLNDEQAARQIAAHNLQCEKDKGCEK